MIRLGVALPVSDALRFPGRKWCSQCNSSTSRHSLHHLSAVEHDRSFRPKSAVMTGASVSRRPLLAKLRTGCLELDARAASIILPGLGKRHNGRVGNVLRPTSVSSSRLRLLSVGRKLAPVVSEVHCAPGRRLTGRHGSRETRWIHFSSVVLAARPVSDCFPFTALPEIARVSMRQSS